MKTMQEFPQRAYLVFQENPQGDDYTSQPMSLEEALAADSCSSGASAGTHLDGRLVEVQRQYGRALDGTQLFDLTGLTWEQMQRCLQVLGLDGSQPLWAIELPSPYGS